MRSSRSSTSPAARSRRPAWSGSARRRRRGRRRSAARWRRPRRRPPGSPRSPGRPSGGAAAPGRSMSGRCMSSRIRCGAPGADAGQAVARPVIETSIWTCGALREDAAHHLDVGLVVLDVVDDAAVVVGGQGLERRRASERTVSGSTAFGSLRMNDEPSPGTLLTRIEPPISSASRRLITRPMPVPSSRVRSRPEAVEGLEQLVHLLRRHAQAGVGDRDLDHVGRGQPAGDVHPAAVDVVLDGVAEQVGEDLLDARGVAQHGRACPAPSVLADADAAPVGVARDQRDRSRATQLGEVERRRSAGAGCPTRCATGRARR